MRLCTLSLCTEDYGLSPRAAVPHTDIGPTAGVGVATGLAASYQGI